jgi:hypothetical protein
MSFMAEALALPPEVPVIPCVSIVETVAEKFVALTRRAGTELADAGGPRDSTLVRHVYGPYAPRALRAQRAMNAGMLFASQTKLTSHLHDFAIAKMNFEIL